jgi:hypothetical protein
MLDNQNEFNQKDIDIIKFGSPVLWLKKNRKQEIDKKSPCKLEEDLDLDKDSSIILEHAKSEPVDVYSLPKQNSEMSLEINKIKYWKECSSAANSPKLKIIMENKEENIVQGRSNSAKRMLPIKVSNKVKISRFGAKRHLFFDKMLSSNSSDNCDSEVSMLIFKLSNLECNIIQQ